MVLTRFFSNNVQIIAASSRSATTKAQQEASQALLRPGAAPEPSLAAVWEVTGFRNIADGEARHLNFSQSRRKSRARRRHPEATTGAKPRVREPALRPALSRGRPPSPAAAWRQPRIEQRRPPRSRAPAPKKRQSRRNCRS